VAEPVGQTGDNSHAKGEAQGSGRWDVVVARAIHAAQVFGPEGVPPAGQGPDEVSVVRWELAVGAHGAARLLSALWVEATAHGLPVPAEVDAAIGALSAWSRELAMP